MEEETLSVIMGRPEDSTTHKVAVYVPGLRTTCCPQYYNHSA